MQKGCCRSASRKELGQRCGESFSLSHEDVPEAVFSRQCQLRCEPRFAPEFAPGRRLPIELRGCPNIVVPTPAVVVSMDRMHRSERASKRRVVAGPSQVQIFKHQKRFFPPFSPANGRRNARTRRGKRGEAFGLGGEGVKVRAVIDFREELASTALEYERAVDAPSRCGRRAL